MICYGGAGPIDDVDVEHDTRLLNDDGSSVHIRCRAVEFDIRQARERENPPSADTKGSAQCVRSGPVISSHTGNARSGAISAIFGRAGRH